MPTWRDAWDAALYGPGGFYVRETPADHFRTSAHVSGFFAQAILTVLQRHGLSSVTDIGAGSGEVLTRLHALAPELDLLGVDLRERPAGLPPAVAWVSRVPERLTGLVLANELLDNVPCTVVELDGTGVVRVVEVAPETGQERLGPRAPHAVVEWCLRWWPLAARGDRAEVGLEREQLWAGVVARTSQGLCIAIDYGHLRDTRPTGGSLASYRRGRLTPVTLDGTCDVTAHVAVDALAARVSGRLTRQREVLPGLGVRATRPHLGRAASDPKGYLMDLCRAAEAAELINSPGLGDHWWLITPRP